MIPGIVAAGGLMSVGDAPPPTDGWNPTMLSNLLVWLDATQQTEADDAQVTSFRDLTGNGWNYTPWFGSGPFLRHNEVNGRHAIEASSSGFETGGTLLNGKAAASVFYVAKGNADPSSSPADEAPLNFYGNGGVSHYYTDSNWYETFGTSSRRNVDPSGSFAAWHIAGVISASNDFRMYFNGTNLGVTQSPNTVQWSGNPRRLFKRDSGTGSYAGFFAEMIILDAAASDADREKVEAYLAQKYGLVSLLPGGHTYKTVPLPIQPILEYNATYNASTSAPSGVSIKPKYNCYAGSSPVYTVVGGSLPAGLSLNASTGAITGTPTTPGTYSGIQIQIADGLYEDISPAFTIEVLAGYRYWFQEFLASGNNFQGMAQLSLIDSGATDRALASNGASISAVGYTVNGGFPIGNAIDGVTTTFTTSSSASAGAGKGQLVDLGAAYDIDKWGYRSRHDSFGDTEAITSGKLWARNSTSDSYDLIYTISEAGWADNEYRERSI